MARIGWWHCLAGASGDMVLGALVDAGVPLERLQQAVDALGVEPVRLTAESVTRQGVGATRVHVEVTRSTVVRTWPNVRALLQDAPLEERVRRLSLDIFERLARAEAMVHRSSPEAVHFHEIGGLDAFADVVGAATGLHELGLDTVASSPVATGLGMVRTEHGLLPVPTPAVLELLAGAPAYSGGAPYEMCTPTGAAILAATVSRWGEMPPMVVQRVGYGAGERDVDEVPNVLRIVVGESAPVAAPSEEAAVVIECNVDDLDPRLWPGVVSSLLAAGAADAWLTPIQMKKGRPAVTVSVLCSSELADAVRRTLFRETSTIGLRERPVRKRALDRSVVTVSLAGGSEVRVKVATLDGEVVNAVPEFDDVASVAAAEGRPVKVVLAEAAALASRLATT